MRALAAVLATLAAAPVLAAPAAARAPDVPRESGITFALRAGYGAPFGKVSRDGLPVDDLVRNKVPFALELGYRFGPLLQGALYLELARATLEPACPQGESCEASDVRFGLAVRLHLAAARRVDPWLGAGFGIEVMNVAYAPDPGGPLAEIAWSGLEVPVEAGLDVRATERLVVGPVFQATFARFTGASLRASGSTSQSEAIGARATHGWLQLGVRATLRL
jgi:hypothetical protein